MAGAIDRKPLAGWLLIPGTYAAIHVSGELPVESLALFWLLSSRLSRFGRYKHLPSKTQVFADLQNPQVIQQLESKGTDVETKENDTNRSSFRAFLPPIFSKSSRN